MVLLQDKERFHTNLKDVSVNLVSYPLGGTKRKTLRISWAARGSSETLKAMFLSTFIHTLLIWSVAVTSVDSCPPGKETDDAQGRCCFFPFEYNGSTYDNCTNVDRHRPWCSLDAEGKEWAYCGICNGNCNKDYRPVCGTDETTYANECSMEFVTCVNKKNVSKAHDGECRICNEFCTMDYRPVCGTDQTTYGNECSLEYEACFNKKNVSKAHDGECMQWKARGCYRDQKKVLDNKFAPIKVSKKKWYPETFFNIAKELAEKEGFDVFGIRTMKGKKKFVILTTSDGKQVDSYGKDAGVKDCKYDKQFGVGVKPKVNFVYTK